MVDYLLIPPLTQSNIEIDLQIFLASSCAGLHPPDLTVA